MTITRVVASSYSVTRKGKPEPQKILLTGQVARRKWQGQETCLWDTEIPGFGLRLYATGRKSWFVRFVERGRARNWTIGAVETVSAEDAREAARRRLKEVALRGLPSKPKREGVPATVVSFADLVEQFLKDRPFAWKASTEASNGYMIRTALLPAFGTMAVSTIRKQDVMKWRDAMADRPGAYNRYVAVLNTVMQYAEKLGIRKRGSNPAKSLPRYRREPMQRFLETAEYRRLHQRLEVCDDVYMVSAVRLLIHTGARSSEIARLKWGEVSAARLELADSKTGAKTILLSRQAAAVLEALPRGADDELVFKGTKGQPANLSYFWSGMRRTAGLPDVRLHDLRHSYASIAIQNGISLESIGRLLGHALPETTERYAHLTDQNIIEAAETVGGSIFQLMGWADAAL